MIMNGILLGIGILIVFCLIPFIGVIIGMVLASIMAVLQVIVFGIALIAYPIAKLFGYKNLRIKKSIKINA